MYAHPTDDVFTIDKKLNEMTNALKTENDFSIYIMATGDDYWPIPWYLRNIDNVGYWNHIPKDVKSASIVLISPDLEVDLVAGIYKDVKPGNSSLFIPLFNEIIELRPGIKISGWVKKDINDLYERALLHDG